MPKTAKVPDLTAPQIVAKIDEINHYFISDAQRSAFPKRESPLLQTIWHVTGNHRHYKQIAMAFLAAINKTHPGMTVQGWDGAVNFASFKSVIRDARDIAAVTKPFQPLDDAHWAVSPIAIIVTLVVAAALILHGMPPIH